MVTVKGFTVAKSWDTVAEPLVTHTCTAISPSGRAGWPGPPKPTNVADTATRTAPPPSRTVCAGLADNSTRLSLSTSATSTGSTTTTIPVAGMLAVPVTVTTSGPSNNSSCFARI